MRIKLAILESDQSYLNRIVSVFSTKYADKFEIYSFTNEKIAMDTLEQSRIDVFVASESFDINTNAIPQRCGFAYFVDFQNIDTIREQKAICKFQKVDVIYKQILSLYSETAGSFSGLKLDDNSTKVIMFSSPGGGAGTSTVAVACALHYAFAHKRVLYLNLEKSGSSDCFFEGEGMFDMSDIIYAIKSKKANLVMKLESCVKQDNSGVFFYSQPKNVLDMLELTDEDIMGLISELKITGSYDYIIVDLDFGMNKNMFKIYEQSHSIVWVGDGSEISNLKISRTFDALSIMEQHSDIHLLNRICLIYNKFSNKIGRTIENCSIRNIGGAPTYVHANTKQVIEQLVANSMFDNII